MEHEERLMERCRSGDKDAFFLLVEPLLSRAYSSSVAILRQAHTAEDAVQNALLEAYQAIMAGKKIRKFKSWFNHLVACRAMDLARRRAKLNSRHGELDESEFVDDVATPAEVLLKREQESEVLHQVMSLDMNYRTVIILYYYQELSIEEIADVLRIKKGTVKSRLHTARMKLSQMSLLSIQKKVMEC
ncbi:sigma-70 family RNA polymerase sigma factor [Paenibacillus alvei]|uniref:Sigma-70 family RNA polymerase sigma factor n=1 Tax=Paenibacillus alvei TaxID=44250 RepID=A0ABT4GU63_PAEAL|nr:MULTISPECIES: sigma-70 family RNA polymerase sigma factor [Paenibacillus]EJW17882.1 RNA polymerase sigma factor, sigma-70 family [Paenibacillus alvei DSM 29]MCY7483306.1 sigma-70 family RNA polymerase sigma factor [Paenibacillus alvei]MCY9544392.1 sigma-70 family RNA polymerase sigma factor [Paenibacillus alvei]MCY9703388.1 sigma-70 family RNA polymerase sigma factor [Paenibacillus alvei]MCY9738272.1 sigma-70 family RNA polymerase sigma factor [Paenibacillus alvei]